MRRQALLRSMAILVALIGLPIASMPAYAHGGVMLKSGSFGSYEWLVQIYPYPPDPGVGVITLFVFDVEARAPVTDLVGEVLIAPPGDPTPCCEVGRHRGPFALYTDEIVYPGDYTTYLPLDEPGEWQAKFVVNSPTHWFEVLVSIPVDVAPPGKVIDPPAIATQAAIMRGVAESIQQASASQSPLATPDPLQPTSPLTMAMLSPLATPLAGAGGAAPPVALSTEGLFPSRFNGWVWGGMALLVVVGAVASTLRLRTEE